jgi:hypothetical protein
LLAGQPVRLSSPRSPGRRGGRPSQADDTNYWQPLGAKLLSVMLFAAAGTERSMAEVARRVDIQDVDDVATA